MVDKVPSFWVVITRRCDRIFTMSYWKLAPYALGGAGLSLLENKVLGSNLPDPLKKINIGIGATQGAMFGLPGNKAKIMALGSIPVKQMALFGLGEAEKFKNEQEALTNTNLDAAKVNESAAKLHLRDAGTSRAIQLAFLIPALVGAGALGYEALDKYRKSHKKDPRFKNMVEGGTRRQSQKIRIDMPVSALPADFASSFLNSRDRSHFTVKEKDGDDPNNGDGVFRSRRKSASALSNAGSLLWQFTGIPNLLRGGKDLMYGYGALNDSDFKNTGRYALSGLGNLAMGVAAARWGAIPLARLLGKARLSGVIRNALKGESRQFTEAPTAAKYIYRHGFMEDFPNKPRVGYTSKAMEAAGEAPAKYPAINAFDPQRYAWKKPTTQSTIFKSLLTAPDPSAGPQSLLGTMGLGAKYVGNRAVNAGYGARQVMRRYPNATLMLAGTPFANRGTIRDEEEASQQKAMWDKYLPSGGNTGPMGMPVSSVANSILRAMSGTPEPVARQLSGM